MAKIVNNVYRYIYGYAIFITNCHIRSLFYFPVYSDFYILILNLFLFPFIYIGRKMSIYVFLFYNIYYTNSKISFET